MGLIQQAGAVPNRSHRLDQIQRLSSVGTASGAIADRSCHRSGPVVAALSSPRDALASRRQACRKVSSQSHGGLLTISSLHRDGEAAGSELKQDAPPLNADDDQWHRDSGIRRYRRLSREDEVAPPPPSIRGSAPLGEDLLLVKAVVGGGVSPRLAYALQLPQSFPDVR
uniref:Uncharacterized protein n=1 Tax=Oryza meridionalis TaxID=40149 RepID=A0A0E0DRP6_9ORYZ